MPRRPASVTQADLARAIRALRAAGYPLVRVVFRDGAVIVEGAEREGGSGEGSRHPRSWQERIVVL